MKHLSTESGQGQTGIGGWGYGYDLELGRTYEPFRRAIAAHAALGEEFSVPLTTVSDPGAVAANPQAEIVLRALAEFTVRGESKGTLLGVAAEAGLVFHYLYVSGLLGVGHWLDLGNGPPATAARTGLYTGANAGIMLAF